MGFTRLTPVAKVKSGTFKIAAVQRGKKSPFKLQLTIPSTDYTRAFGAAERLAVYLGDGPDAGKLMLEPTTEAEGFKPAALRNCFVLVLPETDTTPQIPLTFENPERRINDGKSMVVDLPEWAHIKGRWQEIQKARSIAAQQNGTNPANRQEAMARIGAIK